MLGLIRPAGQMFLTPALEKDMTTVRQLLLTIVLAQSRILNESPINSFCSLKKIGASSPPPARSKGVRPGQNGSISMALTLVGLRTQWFRRERLVRLRLGSTKGYTLCILYFLPTSTLLPKAIPVKTF